MGMDHVDALVGHLAWPLIALAIVLIFRKPLHGLLEEIRKRVSDKDTSVSLKAGPVDLQVSALDDKVRAIAENQTVLKQAVRDQAGPRAPTSDIPPELLDLANQYLAVDLPNWSDRVRAKDALATEIGTFALIHQVSKDALAQSDNEGLLLALAEIVRLSPEDGDFDRLRQAAPRITRLHVRYRFLQALGGLFDRRFVSPQDAPAVDDILTRFGTGADAPLQAQIERTKARLTTFLAEARLAPA
jgi:hypothetical protein